MRHPSIDKLLNKVGSKYLLVNVVAKRAKEIENNGFYQMKECEYKSRWDNQGNIQKYWYFSKN